MKSIKSQRGVTLVELVITVVIFGILLAMGLPSFQQWMRNLEIRNAAETMMTGLQKAKASALQQNRDVTFWLISNNGGVLDNTCALSTNGNAWVVSVSNPENSCASAIAPNTAPGIVAKQSPGDGYRIATINAQGADRVVFTGLGRATDNDGDATNDITRIDFAASNSTNDDRAYRILITSGGAIRMCEPAVTSSTDNRKC
ncbi:GspH/FimT family pseudopilin [Chitinibacteraceae bacterium HSL-7]